MGDYIGSFDCDDCGSHCEDIYQYDNANTFVCEIRDKKRLNEADKI